MRKHDDAEAGSPTDAANIIALAVGFGVAVLFLACGYLYFTSARPGRLAHKAAYYIRNGATPEEADILVHSVSDPDITWDPL